MSVQISYKKQFLVAIFLASILLTIIEIGSRVWENQSTGSCGVMNSGASQDLDNSLKEQICNDMNKVIYERPDIQRNQPNQHYETININSFGFRGDEISKDKQSETYRIFLVGGSTAFGAGSSSDNNTIPGILQKLLDNERRDYKFEVINAGIPGANSIREEHYIKNYLLEFNPDMIIVYDGLNDAGNAIINRNDLGKSHNNKLEETQNIIGHIIVDYFEWYRTPFVIKYIIFTSTEPISYNDSTISEMKNNWYNRWAEMCEFGNSRDIKIMITLQPILGTGDKILYQDEIVNSESYESQMTVKAINELEEPLQKLSKICSNVLDLRGGFDEIEKPIFYDLGHTNDLGNEIIANKIFEKILPIVLEDISK